MIQNTYIYVIKSLVNKLTLADVTESLSKM